MVQGDRFDRLMTAATTASDAEVVHLRAREEGERWRQRQVEEERMLLWIRRFGVLDYFDAGTYQVVENPLMHLLQLTMDTGQAQPLAITCPEVHLLFYTSNGKSLMVAALCRHCLGPVYRPTAIGSAVYPHTELHDGVPGEGLARVLSDLSAMSAEDKALTKHWYLVRLARFMAMVTKDYGWECFNCIGPADDDEPDSTLRMLTRD